MYSRHVLVALSMGFSMPSFPAVVSALGEKVAADPATALKPINVLDFEAATGVQRRAAEDFSHLDLGTQAQLVYGRPGSTCLSCRPDRSPSYTLSCSVH